MTSHVVTRFYRAPEVILKVPYSNKIDMWAADCIFKEVLELTRPPRLESSKQQVLPAVDPNTVVLFAGECMVLRLLATQKGRESRPQQQWA